MGRTAKISLKPIFPSCLGEKILQSIVLNKLNVKEVVVSNQHETYMQCCHDNAPDQLSPLRSMCKFITALSVGQMLCDFGNVVNLNTRIWPIICGHLGMPCPSEKSNVTIHHLLTQSSGYSDPLLLTSNSNKNVGDFDKLLFLYNTPLDYAPGTKFVYSNASYYLLSVIIQIITSRSLLAYSSENLFHPLNIYKYDWDCWGDYTAGATGLKMRGIDFHNLFTCFFGTNQSRIQHKNLPYLKKMISPQIDTHTVCNSNPLCPKKYCYSLWWINDNIIYISGANGQYHIWDASHQISITLISDEKNNIYDVLRVIANELEIN